MDPEPMLEALAQSGELRPFRGLIGRVEAYDREHNSDLIRTLRAFFAANAARSLAPGSETSGSLSPRLNPEESQ